MVSLKDFFEATRYKISEGFYYGWNCFGDNAHCLEASVYDKYTAEIVFDRETQVVYEVSILDYTTDTAHRWQNPNFVDAHSQEVAARGLEDCAWENVKFTEATEQEVLAKIHTAFTPLLSYSTNWMGPVNLDWTEKNGDHWAAGRIDVYGKGEYPDEIGLPLMHKDDWHSFSECIDTVKSENMLSLEQLVEMYEQKHSPIRWFKHS